MSSGFAGIHLVSKAHILKDDIMSIRCKAVSPIGGLRIVDLHQTTGGDLGHEHLGDQGQSLVERRIDTGDH